MIRLNKKKKKNTKIKHKSIKKLKALAWGAFARYIKARDSNEQGIVKCCTCSKEMIWDDKSVHAGHFVPGRKGSVLFNEDIVHAQCLTCNLFGKGEQARYALFLKKEKGLSDEKIEELLNLKNKVLKISTVDYNSIYEEYNNKAQALMSIKGL